MKALLFLTAVSLLPLAAFSQVEPPPPASEHPLHTTAKQFAKRSAFEAASQLAKGDRKAALESYRKAVTQIPDSNALRKEYYLYRARFTALALQLASDALESDDIGSARSYLTQILAAEINPGNTVAKNLLQTIDPKPVAAVDPAKPETPATPATPAATNWEHKLGDSLPTINREWGFLLMKDVDTGILQNGDLVELVREETVLAMFKVTLPEDTENALVLGVKGVSPIPDVIRKGDVFRLKSK